MTQSFRRRSSAVVSFSLRSITDTAESVHSPQESPRSVNEEVHSSGAAMFGVCCLRLFAMPPKNPRFNKIWRCNQREMNSFHQKRYIVLGLCRKRSPNNRGRLLGETFFVCATSLSLLQCWCLSRIYSQASVPYLAHFSLLRQLFLWGVC